MKNDKNTLKKNFFPLMIDFTNRKVVIFGGGSVGTRKALILSKYADVTIISHTFTLKLTKFIENPNLNSKITLVTTDINLLSDSDILNFISDAFLVIPATSDLELNNRITKIANESKLLINHVTNIGDVIVPSVVHKKGIIIGISTHGQSPAFTKYIRKKLECVISKEYEQMGQLINEIRTYLKKAAIAKPLLPLGRNGLATSQREVVTQSQPAGDFLSGSSSRNGKLKKEILWAVLESESVWNAFDVSYEHARENAYKILSTYNID